MKKGSFHSSKKKIILLQPGHGVKNSAKYSNGIRSEAVVLASLRGVAARCLFFFGGGGGLRLFWWFTGDLLGFSRDVF